MRKIIAATLSAAALAASTSSSFAEACYSLGGGYTTVIRLDLIQSIEPNGTNHTLIFGQWNQPGVFDAPLSGAYEFSNFKGSVRQFGFSMPIPVSQNGNQSCSFVGVLGGAWSLQCSGGTGSNFQNSGSPVALVTCPNTANTEYMIAAGASATARTH